MLYLVLDCCLTDKLNILGMSEFPLSCSLSSFQHLCNIDLYQSGGVVYSLILEVTLNFFVSGGIEFLSKINQ